MRKQILNPTAAEPAPGDVTWLDLDALARVEVTSEDEAHPVEAALLPGHGGGWRAATAGEQTIRIVFDEPRSLSRIHLLFIEEKEERFQEFVLRWFPEGGGPAIEILGQQYNFSPSGTTREVEDYEVKLVGVTALELRIIPDKNRGHARASLAECRLA